MILLQNLDADLSLCDVQGQPESVEGTFFSPVSTTS